MRIFLLLLMPVSLFVHVALGGLVLRISISNETKWWSTPFWVSALTTLVFSGVISIYIIGIAVTL